MTSFGRFNAAVAGYPVDGARPLRRELERQLESPLATKIVTGECLGGSRVRVQARDGAIAFQLGARGEPRHRPSHS